uniref:Uncharacterized protein n=1 Tax=Amphimedon queenslandica TaxID=400682 RepID=A0A1X7V5T2_AMPQE
MINILGVGVRHSEAETSPPKKRKSSHDVEIPSNLEQDELLTVMLGVQLLFNKNKLDEMCKIMEKYHQYVPQLKQVEKVLSQSGDIDEVHKLKAWDTLYGGDQLTVAHASGGKAIRSGHEEPEQQLKGLTPVLEDWH